MENAFSALGNCYDRLHEEDLFAWEEVYLGLLPEQGQGVDFGCGTGRLTRRLAAPGRPILGVESSPDMLNACRPSQWARFVQGDMTVFRPPHAADFVTVINDGLNYLPPAHLPAAIRHFARCLKKGGLFAADLSTPKKLKATLGNNQFFRDEGDLVLLWQNRLEADSVVLELTLFEREGDLYRRREECQRQYWHTRESLADALTAAGLTGEIRPFPGQEEDRWLIVAKKARPGTGGTGVPEGTP